MPQPTKVVDRARRPGGQYRFPLVDKGNALRFRVLNQVHRVDETGKMQPDFPGFDVHRFGRPTANDPNNNETMVCIQEGCSDIYLPDGTSLHGKPMGNSVPCVIVWVYDKREMAILELGWTNYSTMKSDLTSQYWGDPRGFDYEMYAEDAPPGSRAKIVRKIRAIPNRDPLPADVVAFCTQHMMTYWNAIWPQPKPEEIATFLGGSYRPGGVAPMNPSGGLPFPTPGIGAPPPVPPAPGFGGGVNPAPPVPPIPGNVVIPGSEPTPAPIPQVPSPASAPPGFPIPGTPPPTAAAPAPPEPPPIPGTPPPAGAQGPGFIQFPQPGAGPWANE